MEFVALISLALDGRNVESSFKVNLNPHISHLFSSVSIVDFEQVSVSWEL